MSGAGDGLRFEVKRIMEEGGLCAEFELDAAHLLAQDWPGARPEGGLRLKAEFSVGGSRILMQAKLSGAWTLVCGRCLAEHRLDYAGSVDETYPASAQFIDIAEDVRQAMLLEIPLRSLCRPDCKGLCPRCGRSLSLGACGCGPDASSHLEASNRLTIPKEKDHAES